MSRRQQWTLSAFAFVVVAGVLSAIVQYLTTQALETVKDYGYTPNPQGTAAFLRELDHPTFGEAAQDAVEKARGIDTFLYRATDKAHRAAYETPWTAWDQGQAGTCVSMAFGLASYTSLSVDWTLGKLTDPPLCVATEPIYGGSRTAARQPPITYNSGGDGSYGGAAARWISGKCANPEVGGILFREKYADADLSNYSIPLSRAWGASGVPLRLAKLAAEHRAEAVACVTTWDEFAASIESGFAVVLCSDVGYGGYSSRDADGFLPRGSSWAHAMVCTAVRYKKNGSPRDGGLIQNSWSARWLSGPKWPADQPDGSFWADRKNIEAALAQGDSFAVGGVTGFRFRDLHNGKWLEGK